MKALASPGREGDEVKVKVYGSRTCKPNFVRRIAPAGRSFLWAAHYCGALATYPKVLRAEPARACNRRSQTPFLFGLAPCVVCPARCITAAAVRSYRTFSPLPSSRKMGRYVLCGTFRRTGLNPASRTLSGTLLCGVRTFLSPRPAVSGEDAESDRPVQLPTRSLYDAVSYLKGATLNRRLVLRPIAAKNIIVG